jgi:hypothetical protein
MSITQTIKEFEKLLGDTIIDGGYDMSNKEDNWLSARDAEKRLKSFLLRSHLNYLLEEKKRLEGEIKEKHDWIISKDETEKLEHDDIEWELADISASIALAFNSAITQQLQHLEEEIEEIKKML